MEVIRQVTIRQNTQTQTATACGSWAWSKQQNGGSTSSALFSGFGQDSVRSDPTHLKKHVKGVLGSIHMCMVLCIYITCWFFVSLLLWFHIGLQCLFLKLEGFCVEGSGFCLVAKFHSSNYSCCCVLCIGFCVYPLQVLIASHQYSPLFIREYFHFVSFSWLPSSSTYSAGQHANKKTLGSRTIFGCKIGPPGAREPSKKKDSNLDTGWVCILADSDLSSVHSLLCLSSSLFHTEWCCFYRPNCRSCFLMISWTCWIHWCVSRRQFRRCLRNQYFYFQSLPSRQQTTLTCLTSFLSNIEQPITCDIHRLGDGLCLQLSSRWFSPSNNQ